MNNMTEGVRVIESLNTNQEKASRIDWVDYAKGLCIFLVVMLHANYEINTVQGSGGWLDTVVAFARPFRMPDFFMLSGLFLSNVISRPWRDYLDKKVVHFFYFYLLWTGIYFVLFGIKTALNDNGGDWSTVLPAYLLTFIQPGNSLWFVHSLATFFLLTRLLRNVPSWIILAGAAALQMMNIQTGWQAIDEFCLRFIYFYSGYVFARYVFAAADWAGRNRLGVIVYLLIWGGTNQYLVARGWSVLPGVGLLLGYVGALAVIFFSVILSSIRWTTALKQLGKLSIVLYLSDQLMQRVALKFGIARVGDPGSTALLLTFISVFGAFAMYWVAKRTGFTFLYQRPRWATFGKAEFK